MNARERVVIAAILRFGANVRDGKVVHTAIRPTPNEEPRLGWWLLFRNSTTPAWLGRTGGDAESIAASAKGGAS